MFLPILSAVLGIFAFLPFGGFWIFSFVFLAPIFVFLTKENKLWRLLLGVFVFKIIFTLGTAYFAFEPFTWFFSILIFLGLPLSVFLIKNLSALINPSVFYFSPFAFPFLWLFWEFIEAEYFFLPSYLINTGNALGSSPFLGLAAFGGQFSLSLFILAANALLTAGILNIKKNLLVPSAVFLTIIIIGLTTSNYLLKKNAENYGSLKNTLKIAAISSSENFNINDFKLLKEELKKKEQIDLLILPEDILNIQNSGLETAETKNLAKNLNTKIISVFGTFQNNKKYNSAVLFTQNGEVAGVYNKKYLTFIGEYWPFGNWRPFYFDWLKNKNPRFKNYAVFEPKNQYSRGVEKVFSITFNDGKTAKFASPICLEIQYPLYMRLYKKMGVNFFINPSSNRWLNSGTNHYLYLNNNLRKITAVWLKTPVILSGIKDFAGIIEPNGEIKTAFYGKDKNYAVFFSEIRY